MPIHELPRLDSLYAEVPLERVHDLSRVAEKMRG